MDALKHSQPASRIFDGASNALVSIFAALSICSSVCSAYAQSIFQSEYIKPADPSEEARFGQSILMEEKFLAVGASGGESLHLFRTNGSGNWQEVQVIGYPNQPDRGSFGRSVAATEHIFLVGAPSEDGDENSENLDQFQNAGAVYVYARVGDLLNSPRRLTPSNHLAGSRFGWAIDASSNGKVIIGAPERQHPIAGSFAGSAYIFEPDAEGNLVEIEFFESPEMPSSRRFGGDVQITDSWAFVGARGTHQAGGAVYVYERMALGWEYRQKLIPSGLESGLNFGHSLSVDGARAAIGAFGATGSGGEVYAGNVYIFELIDGNWAEVDRLEAPNPTEGAWFGFSVTLDGDQVLVGANLEKVGDFTRAGSAHLFTRTMFGWAVASPILPPCVKSRLEFGTAVALRTGVIAVGAIGEDGDGSSPADSSMPNSGAVFLYSPSDWVFRSRFEGC